MISRKRQPREVDRNFEMNFRKFPVPFDFEPEFSEILVEWNAPKIINWVWNSPE